MNTRRGPNELPPMRSKSYALIASLIIALTPMTASAQLIERGNDAVLEMVPRLKPGQYVWAPELSGDGPALVVVNLETQKLVLFRNGVPMAASTVSSGKPGHETPTGVFTILQKHKEHYSSTYNNAPMPNMQRLTWQGVALHAGKLPGYPASHGCVRLPMQFSDLLFGATDLGMTVVITSMPAVPQSSGEPGLVVASDATNRQTLAQAHYEWHPERSTEGIVSVVISAADESAIVLRGGIEIGSAPVRVGGRLNGAIAYVLRALDDTGKHWLKLQFSGPGGSMEVGADEANRFDAPQAFRNAVASAVRPGSVVIVTPESLKAGSPGVSATVIEGDESPR